MKLRSLLNPAANPLSPLPPPPPAVRYEQCRLCGSWITNWVDPDWAKGRICRRCEALNEPGAPESNSSYSVMYANFYGDKEAWPVRVLRCAVPKPPVFWKVRGETLLQVSRVHGELGLLDRQGRRHSESAYDPNVRLAANTYGPVYDTEG